MKNNKWFIPILVIAVNALAVIVKWSSLPELLPAHFDLQGNASGTMTRSMLPLYPAASAAICVFLGLIAIKAYRLKTGLIVLSSGISLIILLIVTFLFYLLLRSMPASFVETTAMQLSQTPGAKPYHEWLDQLNTQYGLDENIFLGYLRQLKSLLTFHFGDSWKYAVPVTEKFSQTIGISAALGATALLLEFLIAVPLGIFAARRQDQFPDLAVSVGALLGISLPAFFFATLLKLIFSVKLGWFDLGGLTGRDFYALSPWGKFWDVAAHLALPLVTLVVISTGSLLRHTRVSMLEELGKDNDLYARLAAIVKRNGGMWCAEAEAYLLAHAPRL